MPVRLAHLTYVYVCIVCLHTLSSSSRTIGQPQFTTQVPPLPASLHLTHFETNPNDIPIRPAPTYVCFNKDGIDRIEPNYVEGGATMLLPAQE